MGSLNEIGKKLADKIRGPLLIIDYVSTPLVLEIGQLIQRQMSIAEISQKIDIENKVKKQLILTKKRKNTGNLNLLLHRNRFSYSNTRDFGILFRKSLQRIDDYSV